MKHQTQPSKTDVQSSIKQAEVMDKQVQPRKTAAEAAIKQAETVFSKHFAFLVRISPRSFVFSEVLSLMPATIWPGHLSVKSLREIYSNERNQQQLCDIASDNQNSMS